MSVHHFNLNVSEIIPQPEAQKQDEGLHPNLFEALIPKFKERVKFALIEILELDRTAGAAKTWGYSSLSEEDFAVLVKEYLDIVRMYSDPEHTVSNTNHFYFGECIYFSKITNPEAPPVYATSDWKKSQESILPESYHEDNSLSCQKVRESYHKYVLAMESSILKQYPVSYILCVPVALTGRHPRKIGAAFIHIGLNEQFDSEEEQHFAKESFRMVNLYWHYYLTSESLRKQVEFAVASKAEAVKAAGVTKAAQDEQVHYEKQIAPAVDRLEKLVKEIKLHVAARPNSKALMALQHLEELYGERCFKGEGKHDPYEHSDLSALTNVHELASPWLVTLAESLQRTETFQAECDHTIVTELLRPLSELESGIGENTPEALHPALCLAKCISHKRIPIAWFVLVLGIQEVEAIRWRHYVPFDSENHSVLDVLYSLRALVNRNRLGLTGGTMQQEKDRVDLFFVPTWEDTANGYERFCERMAVELKLDNPSGGTARHLRQLLQVGYQVNVEPVSGTKRTYKETDDRVRCVISVKHDAVQFSLFSIPEETRKIHLTGNW